MGITFCQIRRFRGGGCGVSSIYLSLGSVTLGLRIHITISYWSVRWQVLEDVWRCFMLLSLPLVPTRTGYWLIARGEDNVDLRQTFFCLRKDKGSPKHVWRTQMYSGRTRIREYRYA